MTEEEQTPVFSLHVKCKPTYNFQTIEFEWDLTEDNYSEMLEWYDKLVQGLRDVAPEQPDNKKAAPKVPLATSKQKALMKKLGLDFDDNTTAKEATKLIDEYFEEK